MNIVKVDGTDIEMQKWIRWMDAEVFPDDVPVTFAPGTVWFILYEEGLPNTFEIGGTPLPRPVLRLDETYSNHGVPEPVAYAAWRPHYPMETVGELHWQTGYGFLYRAGVLKKARGKGYQKELIRARENSMKEMKIPKSITYTNTSSIASMKSLMAEGYKPYAPTASTNLAGVGRAEKFVHWEKDL